MNENIGIFEVYILAKSKKLDPETTVRSIDLRQWESLAIVRSKSIEAHFKWPTIKSFYPTLILFYGKAESLQHASEDDTRFNLKFGVSLPYN